MAPYVRFSPVPFQHFLCFYPAARLLACTDYGLTVGPGTGPPRTLRATMNEGTLRWCRRPAPSNILFVLLPTLCDQHACCFYITMPIPSLWHLFPFPLLSLSSCIATFPLSTPFFTAASIHSFLAFARGFLPVSSPCFVMSNVPNSPSRIPIQSLLNDPVREKAHSSFSLSLSQTNNLQCDQCYKTYVSFFFVSFSSVLHVLVPANFVLTLLALSLQLYPTGRC